MWALILIIPQNPWPILAVYLYIYHICWINVPHGAQSLSPCFHWTLHKLVSPILMYRSLGWSRSWSCLVHWTLRWRRDWRRWRTYMTIWDRMWNKQNTLVLKVAQSLAPDLLCWGCLCIGQPWGGEKPISGATITASALTVAAGLDIVDPMAKDSKLWKPTNNSQHQLTLHVKNYSRYSSVRPCVPWWR